MIQTRQNAAMTISPDAARLNGFMRSLLLFNRTFRWALAACAGRLLTVSINFIIVVVVGFDGFLAFLFANSLCRFVVLRKVFLVLFLSLRVIELLMRHIFFPSTSKQFFSLQHLAARICK
jgi:hypothetical protein